MPDQITDSRWALWLQRGTVLCGCFILRIPAYLEFYLGKEEMLPSDSVQPICASLFKSYIAMELVKPSLAVLACILHGPWGVHRPVWRVKVQHFGPYFSFVFKLRKKKSEQRMGIKYGAFLGSPSGNTMWEGMEDLGLNFDSATCSPVALSKSFSLLGLSFSIHAMGH